MTESSYVAFVGENFLARGSVPELAQAIKYLGETAPPVLIFESQTGVQTDFDLRGSAAEIAARLRASVQETPANGRGRPKLGVVGREITLLPRHWEWLASQSGGASVALRKLVEAAMRDPEMRRKHMREAAYRFMSAMAGDREHFVEASRALFAGDLAKFSHYIEQWPPAVAQELRRMTKDAFQSPAEKTGSAE